MFCEGSVSRRTLLSQAQAVLLVGLPVLAAPGRALAMAGIQYSWGVCNKCAGVFWDGDNNNKGRCTAGGAHMNNGYNYYFHYDDAKTAGAIQYDWRFCNKCWTMFWDGDPNNKGRCAVGGAHHAQGLMFGLYTQSPSDVDSNHPVVTDCRFCNRCWELFWNSQAHIAGNVCPAGGAHTAQGFIFYTHQVNFPVPGFF
jgi:hypothetical protein